MNTPIYEVILGRKRKIVVQGRNKYVKIKGELVSLTQARKLSKSLKMNGGFQQLKQSMMILDKHL